LGGIIAVLALAVRKELLIPVIVWNIPDRKSVGDDAGSLLQIHEEKYGEGRRIFLMSPLHHHYQKKNIHESKIVTRFGLWEYC
jgi:phospho-N-acetylmuramoyl-pentapeptide-transferase